MIERAYSILQIKEVNEEQRLIRGIATHPSIDRQGDSIDPFGIKSATDIPLFLYHDSKQTVGRARLGKPTKNGVPFEASIVKVKEEGRLRDRVEEAWQMLKYKLINAVSIGFLVLNDAYEKIKETGGYLIKEAEVLELSLVPIPAQPEAVITSIKASNPRACADFIQTIKSIDERQRAALGRKSEPPDDRSRPGAAGHQERAASSGGFSFSRSQKGGNNMNLKELREARAAKAARMKELIDLWEQPEHETSDDETTEYDGLQQDVKKLDMEIRKAEFHATNSAAAKSVDGSSSERASASRGGMSFVRREDPEDKFKGQSYIRSVVAKLKAYHAGPGVSPAAVAQARWGKSHPNLCMWIKANEVAGGGEGSGEWGSELVSIDNRFTGDFLEYLYGLTVFDRLPLRGVPANVAIKGQDGAATGYWVGESKAIPMSKADFSSVDLRPLKVAAVTVASNEWFEDSTPDGEMLLRDALGQASAQRVDTTFLSNAAAVSGVSPAGILNGVSAISTAGTDAAGVRADIAALYAPFIAARNSSGLYFVTNPSVSKALQLMRNALGQREFDTIANGTLEGDPMVTGDNVGGGDLILLKPTDIWRIGDTGVRVEVSREAMIEQSTAPTGATDTPVAASQYFTSMFQEESTAVKIVRRINFGKRRTGSVQYVGDAAYGALAT